MKILMVTDRMQLGGAETHVYTLIRELVRLGHTVSLMTSGGVYGEMLEKEGVPLITAPLDKRNINSYTEALGILRHNIGAYDIVHAHTRYTAYLARRARGSVRFPAIICTAHLTFKPWPYRRIAYWGDATLAVSEDIRDYLIREYGIPKERIALTKNGIDTSLFTKREHGCGGVIAHVSRIDRGRSLCAFLLVGIAQELAESIPKLRIYIAGDGNDFGELSAKAREVNKRLGREAVTLTGALTDVREILWNADIFVGVSRAALEAMAMGLPVVISGDEGYGGIYSSENMEILEKTNFCARGLKRANRELLLRDTRMLLEDPVLCKKLGEISCGRVRERYSSLSMAEDAVRVYERVWRAPRLLLLGYVGYGNFGDEAAHKIAKRELRKRGIEQIFSLSSGRSRSPSEGVYNRFSPLDIIRAVRLSDTLVLCGGNLLQNETGLPSLLYYSALIRYAYGRRRTVIMLGCGFGEIYGRLGGRMMSRAIRRCSFIGARTALDLEVAKRSLGKSGVTYMPDLCYLYGRSPHFGERKYFSIIGGSTSFFAHIPLGGICEEHGLTPIIIILFGDEDGKESLRFGEKNNIECFSPSSPSELSRHLSRSAFTISERLHGAIFSVISHTPAYLCDTSLKHRAQIDEIGRVAEEVGTPSPLFALKTCGEYYSVPKKEETEACRFDFPGILNKLSDSIKTSLDEIF